MWQYNYATSDELYHHGVKGMKWGYRKSRLERAASAQQRDANNLRKHGYAKEAEAVQGVANKTKAKAESKKSNRQIRKENKKAIRERGKAEARKKAEANKNRILSEIQAYDKKVGGDYAKHFLETYDDIEMWDLYSPEELKKGAW